MAPFCSGSERRADVCIIADSSVAIQDCSGNSLEEHKRRDVEGGLRRFAAITAPLF